MFMDTPNDLSTSKNENSRIIARDSQVYLRLSKMLDNIIYKFLKTVEIPDNDSCLIRAGDTSSESAIVIMVALLLNLVGCD